MLHKVLAFMKTTALKSLWVELTETLTDKNGDRQKNKQTNETNKQTNYLHGAEPSATQQIPSIFCYPNVRYCVHKRPPLDSIPQ
jgi:hypothetical protein